MEVGSLTEANWTEEYEGISLSIILELCEEIEPLKNGGEFSHGVQKLIKPFLDMLVQATVAVSS
jgi:hypothetical protein